MIGNAKEYEGLYYLENKGPVKGHAQVSQCEFVSSEIMLWHYRLGHPNFPYLKILFPSLFKNKYLSLLHCDFCPMAKQTRVPFPAHTYKPSQPFSLIHSDIWGLSRVNNPSKAKWFITFIDDHSRTT